MQLIVLFVGIILFFVLALAITNFIQRRKGNTTTREVPPPAIDLGGGCCGAHEVCEKDSLIAAFLEKPEYFDDEELDKFARRDSAQYTAGEADEFREVFYSVLDEEKPRWVRSLQMRGISLPDQLKDEVLMFVNELRAHKMHA
ncbi:MAG: phospholipase [Proteiniphilum sp.]|nr:phospholipase [Proteiniphilum sp.]MDD3075917.1 phospholipase [Proteiniphilum sp.]MDD3780533.1 phospholipase [Proteiniphilum sp.]MDD4452607.1 phospholipase [Proteiniphilum sp.]NCB25276.1 phospholipase [Bacteroidia bacterium]